MEENSINDDIYRSSYAEQAGQNPGGMQGKPKKRHTGLIIGLSVLGVLILGAAAAFVFAKDVIINKYMLMTKTERGYFEWVAGREVDAVCESMEASLQKKDAKNGLFPQEGEGTARTSVKTHISQEFTDMLNLYPIKDIRLDTDAAFSGNCYSFSFSPYYNDNRLFSANMLYSVDAEKLEAELPDYRQGIIDLSSFLKIELQDDKTVGGMIREYVDELNKNLDKYKPDAGKVCGQYRRYTDALIESISDVKLNTDAYAAVGDDTVKCTEIRITVSGKELKDQLKSISRLFMEDYGSAVNDELKKTEISLKQEDIDKAIDSISDDISGKLVMYVDKKADLIAIDAKCTYKASTVGAKIRWEKTSSGTKGRIGLSLNQINAVDIGFEVKESKGRQNVHLSLTPDAFVDTFLGDYKGFSIEADFTQEAYSNTSAFTLLKSGNVFANIEFSSSYEAFSGNVLDEAGKTVYPVENITETDYLSIPDAVRFGIGILDKINEPELEEKIDELLSENFEGMTIEGVRKMLEDGTLDMMFDPGQFNIDDQNNSDGNNTGDNSGDNGGMAGESNTGDGIADGNNGTENGDGTDGSTGTDGGNTAGIGGYPTERVITKAEYPEASDIYYYSYSELADYAVLGQYKGRVFKMPAPKKADAEALEKEKQRYLSGLENSVLFDQSEISVEMGDEVYLDIMPYLYGIAIEAYHFTDSYAKIGEDMYGEGLDAQIIGMKAGETKDITTKLGSQFGDFAGIEATFRVTVSRIERYMKPEWTEEFICKGLGFESLEACSDMLMENLKEDAEVTDDEIMYTLEQEAIQYTRYLEIPQDLYDKQWNRYYNELYDLTEAFGQTPEEYFADEGIEPLELYAMIDENIEEDLCSRSFYAAAAKAENISITGSELIEIINDYMGYFGYDSFEEFTKNFRLEQVIDSEIEARIGSIILENAIIQPAE